jgi:ribosomal protein L11 methylase PrmA
MSATEQTAEAEIKQGERFAFGENWARFLSSLNRPKIEKARDSMEAMVGVPVATVLKGQRFLDAGSGSGLSSLVAHEAGARVHSFDFDLASVACTEELK